MAKKERVISTDKLQKPPVSKGRQPRPKPPAIARMTADEIRCVIPNYKAMGLDLATARFVAIYISNGMDATAAYKAANGKYANHVSYGQKATILLRSPQVQAAIAQYMQAWLAERREKLESKIIETLWQQAFYDPADFIRPDGSPCFDTWEQVPVEKRVCIVSIKTLPRGQSEMLITELTLCDRAQALEKLARYVNLFAAERDTNSLTLKVDEPTQERLSRIFSVLPMGNKAKAG